MDEQNRKRYGCENCPFWNVHYGTCRRHAPVTSVEINGYAFWPRTKANDICGEHPGVKRKYNLS